MYLLSHETQSLLNWTVEPVNMIFWNETRDGELRRHDKKAYIFPCVFNKVFLRSIRHEKTRPKIQMNSKWAWDKKLLEKLTLLQKF